MNERQIPDGDPIPPSDFRLGQRYSAEDMYRDYPDLKPGDRVAVEKDGVIYTDTVQGFSYSSPEPEIVRRLSRWQRIVRRLTPKRFRKSLVVQPHKPAKVTVTVGDGDPMQRQMKALTDVQNMVDGFLKDR